MAQKQNPSQPADQSLIQLYTTFIKNAPFGSLEVGNDTIYGQHTDACYLRREYVTSTQCLLVYELFFLLSKPRSVSGNLSIIFFLFMISICKHFKNYL